MARIITLLDYPLLHWVYTCSLLVEINTTVLLYPGLDFIIYWMVQLSKVSMHTGALGRILVHSIQVYAAWSCGFRTHFVLQENRELYYLTVWVIRAWYNDIDFLFIFHTSFRNRISPVIPVPPISDVDDHPSPISNFARNVNYYRINCHIIFLKLPCGR